MAVPQLLVEGSDADDGDDLRALVREGIARAHAASSALIAAAVMALPRLRVVS